MSKLRFIWFFVFLPHLCIAQDEVYVLFRGIHFTSDQLMPVIDMRAGQDCVAPRFLDVRLTARYTANLQRLCSTGPFSHDGATFPSVYDWMQEYYVNKYARFKEDLKNERSFLRCLLKDKCQLRNIMDIFLISTSLDCETGLQYSAGMCCPTELRRYPFSSTRDKKISTLLGFYDIFVIPVADINRLFPYFVVEEFARHHMRISTCTTIQKAYQSAEEVNFPFFIPGQYHCKRFKMDVSTFPFSKWKDKYKELDDEKYWKKFNELLRGRLKTVAKNVDDVINRELARARKTRVYLGPLANSFKKRSYHLVPSEAVNVRNKIERQISAIGHRFFNAQEQQLRVENVQVNFYTAYALQKLGFRGYPMSVHLDFSLESSGVKYLPIVFDAPGLEKVFLKGKDGDGVFSHIEYDEENIHKGQVPLDYFDREFPFWRTPNAAIRDVVVSLSKRKHKLELNITGQSLDPETYCVLLNASREVTVKDDNRDDDEYYAEDWWLERQDDMGAVDCDDSNGSENSHDSYDQDLDERMGRLQVDDD